jgi:hypothetical protein
MIRLFILEIAVLEQGWPEIGLENRKEIGVIARAIAKRIYNLRKYYLYEKFFLPASSILS